jgi:hypothetical protein
MGVTERVSIAAAYIVRGRKGSTEEPAEPGTSDGDESLLLQPEHILRRVM